MLKKIKTIELWCRQLDPKPENPAVMLWILLAWLMLCTAMLYKCG